MDKEAPWLFHRRSLWSRSRTLGLAILLPLMLTAASSGPSTPMPDAVAAGRAAAQLSDWQTMTYFLMVIIVALLVFLVVHMAQYRGTAKLMAEAVDRLAEAQQLNSTDIKVNLALIQDGLARMERK